MNCGFGLLVLVALWSLGWLLTLVNLKASMGEDPSSDSRSERRWALVFYGIMALAVWPWLLTGVMGKKRRERRTPWAFFEGEEEDWIELKVGESLRLLVQGTDLDRSMAIAVDAGWRVEDDQSSPEWQLDRVPEYRIQRVAPDPLESSEWQPLQRMIDGISDYPEPEEDDVDLIDWRFGIRKEVDRRGKYRIDVKVEEQGPTATVMGSIFVIVEGEG